MRRVKRGILALFNWLGPRIAPPIIRWLASGVDGANLDVKPSPGPPAPYVSPDGSPLTVWLLNAATHRIHVAGFGSETIQRDLNACMELMRLDAFFRPLSMMYASLLASGQLPIEEIFVRIFANVLLLGFTAGRIHAWEGDPPDGSAPAVPEDEAPDA